MLLTGRSRKCLQAATLVSSFTVLISTFRFREPKFPWFQYIFKPLMIYLTTQEWWESARRCYRKKIFESYYGEDLAVNIHNQLLRHWNVNKERQQDLIKIQWTSIRYRTATKVRHHNLIYIHPQTLPHRKVTGKRHHFLMNIYEKALAIVELVISLLRAQFIFKTERGRENGGEQQPGGQNVHQTRRY